MDFLFHKVSENEKKEIQKQAKKIMDDFSGQLGKVKGEISESLIDRGEGQRDEGSVECNKISREIMFENAPEKKGDFIVGEEKSWS